MATPNLVQTASNANNAGGTTQNLAFTNNNVAGNMIIVQCTCNSSDTISSPTDSQGNTYNLIYNDTTAADPRGGAWFAYNIKSGANTVTGHYGGLNNEFTMIIREYSGVTTKNPLDTFIKAAGNSTAIASGNATPTGSAYRLVIGFGHEGFGSGQTWAINSTGFGNLVSLSTNGGEGGALMDKIVGVLGTESAAFTLGTAATWIGAVATFLPSGGSFTPRPNRPHMFSPGNAR